MMSSISGIFISTEGGTGGSPTLRLSRIHRSVPAAFHIGSRTSPPGSRSRPCSPLWLGYLPVRVDCTCFVACTGCFIGGAAGNIPKQPFRCVDSPAINPFFQYSACRSSSIFCCRSFYTSLGDHAETLPWQRPHGLFKDGPRTGAWS